MSPTDPPVAAPVSVPGPGWWWRVAARLAVRPRLWVTAVVQLSRLARRGWWRRPPFLPMPDRAYLAFRLETMYGTGEAGGTAVAEPADVIEYLHWCRAFPHA